MERIVCPDVKFCTNDNSLYLLCDGLLALNIDDGLIAIWNQDASRLNNIKRFEKIDYFDFMEVVFGGM